MLWPEFLGVWGLPLKKPVQKPSNFGIPKPAPIGFKAREIAEAQILAYGA